MPHIPKNDDTVTPRFGSFTLILYFDTLLQNAFFHNNMLLHDKT
jgi:hypothetical protein